jgi:hypothetical protein
MEKKVFAIDEVKRNATAAIKKFVSELDHAGYNTSLKIEHGLTQIKFDRYFLISKITMDEMPRMDMHYFHHLELMSKNAFLKCFEKLYSAIIEKGQITPYFSSIFISSVIELSDLLELTDSFWRDRYDKVIKSMKETHPTSHGLDVFLYRLPASITISPTSKPATFLARFKKDTIGFSREANDASFVDITKPSHVFDAWVFNNGMGPHPDWAGKIEIKTTRKTVSFVPAQIAGVLEKFGKDLLSTELVLSKRQVVELWNKLVRIKKSELESAQQKRRRLELATKRREAALELKRKKDEALRRGNADSAKGVLW